MAKVFIVQDDGRKNLSPALQFGEIEVLATRDLTIFGNPNGTIMEFKHKLQHFDPATDFLIPAGDPLLIGLAFHIIADKHQLVPCLKWDRQSMTYFQITIPL